MTEPCTKEAEIARIDQRTLDIKEDVKEIKTAVIGTNGRGVKGKVVSHTVQLGIQWVLILGLFSFLIYRMQ